MTVEETVRWNELFQIAYEKTGGYIDATKFNRLLVGLKDDPTVVTEKDRAYFRQAGKEPAKMLGRAPSTKPRIREVSSKSKRQ
jgi:hypothetical protein